MAEVRQFAQHHFGTVHGEGRDDHHTFAVQRPGQGIGEALAAVSLVVVAVTVGGVQQEHVCPGERLGGP
ncbi:hypothetical protein [Streptomyces axinellae]|uniref:hypothetical protein n=1 Tax=Streptomyces axinellae TaxID=552788 RepID=UPI0031D2A4C2